MRKLASIQRIKSIEPIANADSINDILSMSETFSLINSGVMCEGIVIRLKESKELVSFKAISNEFLLKYGE